MPTSSATVGLASLNEEFLLAKCNYFLDVQLWPLKAKLNPEAWLSNFNTEEREYALHLLHAFTFYSEQLTDELFVAAIHNLSTVVCSPTDPFLVAQSAWQTFLGQAVVTYVEGEAPSPTDSGLGFARRARTLLRFPENRIVEPGIALARQLRQSPPPPIIFVDDFVGSGDQFVATWHRTRNLPNGVVASFASIAQQLPGTFFYCPLLCTAQGAAHLRASCPELTLAPAHTLSPRDSILHPESYIWPEHLRPAARDIIQQISARAGILAWEGYSSLSLAVAFHHSVPDATLPLYYWTSANWKPLVHRT